MKTIVICSGGLDSVTLAHKVAAEGAHAHSGWFLRLWPAPQKGTGRAAGLRGIASRCRTTRSTSPQSGALLNRFGAHRGDAVPEGIMPKRRCGSPWCRTATPSCWRLPIGGAARQADAVAAAVHGGDHFIYPGLPSGFRRAHSRRCSAMRWRDQPHRALHSVS